jgi:hypothetical protein
VKFEITGLPLVLFLAFFVLKLCGVIHWSWWWVTSPLWLPIVIVGAIIIIGAAIMTVVDFYRRTK